MYGLRVTALALKISKEEVAYACAVVSMSPLLESRITGMSAGIACSRDDDDDDDEKYDTTRIRTKMRSRLYFFVGRYIINLRLLSH